MNGYTKNGAEGSLEELRVGGDRGISSQVNWLVICHEIQNMKETGFQQSFMVTFILEV